MEHCCDIIKCLSTTSSLEAAGFAVSDEDIFRLGDDLHAEETFSDFHGMAAFSLSGRRQRRNLGRMRGWPVRMDLIWIPGRAEAIMQELKQDEDNYNELMKLYDERTFKCGLVMERHLMKKTSVKQQLAIAKENGWVTNEDQKEVVKDHGFSPPQTY